ncbi:fructose-specific phosphotransferase enzyme IIA component [Desulfosarcina variabilis str. Montpellier]|jgi:PTS system mannose-specific IIA component|uniref:PTS sugar transporter subunit IIA n=1 Tax=Desulfosarcina variabilis TaxID=2300 RepID=UPI003AFB7260
MIGVLVVTHCHLGDALLEAVDFILGERPEAMAAVSIDLNENADKLRNKLADAIKKLKNDEGTLILTDMFGGTPSNLSYSFLEEGRIEVVSGVNLPILIRAASARKNQSLAELAANIEAFGKKSISMASGILKGNKRG